MGSPDIEGSCDHPALPIPDRSWRSLAEILYSPTSITDRMASVSYRKIYSWIKENSESSTILREALSVPELRRAAYLGQLGYHPDPNDVPVLNQYASVETLIQRLSTSEVRLYNHQRFTHIFLVTEYLLETGRRLGLPVHDTALLAAAGIYHDLGHAALSHVGDEAIRFFERSSHEDRSISILSRHARAMFVEPLTKIVREDPGLGQILRLIDTHAYLQVDLLEANQDLGYKNIMPFVGKHIRFDSDTGYLIADNQGKGAILDLLNVRARAYALLYTHPASLIIEAMHIKGLKALIERGDISLDTLKYGTDDTMYGALLHDALNERHAGNLFGGFHMSPTIISQGPYIPVDWIPVDRLNGMTLEQMEQQFQQRWGVETENFVIVIPQTPNSKVIRIRTPGGESEDLQAAPAVYHPLQDHVIVCCYRGLPMRGPSGFTLL